MRSFFLLLPLAALAADMPAKIEYNRDVRPILTDACFRCHGFDKNTREADRRLDTREGALDEKEGIRAIVPGDPAASDAWVRMLSTDKDEVMPPPKAHRQLTAREKEIVKRWIEQGAEYQAHWAYLPVAKPAVPPGSGNPIDAFLSAKQAERGLTPVGEADAATLARRYHLDLTGLPPTPAQVAEFSPAAIERLLASDAHAERMAVWWLDLVRYADSIGYHSDNPRNVTPYRDYVLRAFRDNVRFDRFTREQLAGDLIPNATVTTRVASGYNRLTLTTEEGGAQAKEYEHKSVVDRVKSVGTTWLGQTLMCSECHDHKFDPVTARDFYALGAFFADVKESAIGKREEGMAVPTPEQDAKLKTFDEKVAALKVKLAAPSAELDAAQAEWEKAHAAGPQDVPWAPLAPTKAYADKASLLAVRADATVKVEVAGSPATDTYKVDLTLPAGATGVRLEVLPSTSLPASGPGRAGNGNFVLNEIALERDAKPLKLAQATATFEQANFPAKSAIDGKVDPRQRNGWAVMGHTGKDAALYLELAEPLATETKVTALLTQLYGDNHTIGKFRLSATTAPKPIRAPNKAMPAEVLVALKAAPRTPEQAAKIAEHFRGLAPALAPLRAEIAAAQKERDDFEKTIARSLVTEAAAPRTVRLLARGNWMDDKGEALLPATPHFLPGALTSTKEKRLTRLDLAQWLVARENPLTARVFVNRLWKQFFGTGLSKTLEDMGTQGEMPSHPELLDWLAAEFMDSGWDVRHIVRLMVTSRAYRLTSTAPRDLVQKDLFNRYYARASRWRIDAEFVRDNALAISGLLVTQFGGPSVKPYQPGGYWENLNFPVREWDNDKDRNQWRRGLYTWWQRSYLHPSMVAFDAPSREECAADRLRSNIPQQALALLNDPTYVEAARAFATRMMKEGGATPAERIAWAWQQATARAAKPDEVATLTALLDKHLARYGQDTPAAEAALKVGYAPSPADLPKAELAAYTSVARAILNLHETITRL